MSDLKKKEEKTPHNHECLLSTSCVARVTAKNITGTTLFYPHTSYWLGASFIPHFTEDKTEAQKLKELPRDAQM